MAHSALKIYVHLVFHVKYSSVKIRKSDLPSLHAYITGTIRALDSTPCCVGGINDHIHILCTLPKTYLITDFIQKLKVSSNSYLRTHDNFYKDFHWQRGYGAFSVSANVVNNVIGYISHQEEHHSRLSFEDEYKSFLRSYGISLSDDEIFSD